MTSEMREAVAAYLKRVEAEWRTGQATEHTYRPMLKALLEAMLLKVTAINEPSRIACGAPDYILRDTKSGLNLGFVEAKDLGDADLDGKNVHKEQFTRYKDSLDALCFTDYLDFHFYSHDAFLDSVRIGEIKGDRIALADDLALERFVHLIGRFAEVQPQRITSPKRLAELMAGKARFLAQSVRQYLDDETHADSTLAQQMAAFRQVLIHDIDAASFADIFAQTVTYGLFAARLHDPTPEDFSRDEAAHLIPKTNPLLRQMFQYIAMDSDDSVEWIIDDLVALFGAVDVERLMRGYGKSTLRTDPLLHFYEDFLAAYDPRLRKSRGVWYTPAPVVDFIVRAVDAILTRDFALPGGIADAGKVTVEYRNDFKKTSHSRGKDIIHQDVHRVQILDPAAGTGTFLATAVRRIHEKVAASLGEGAWQGYVSADLLPRLNGFEILMASYAMAHLKLDMLLAETGYVHESNERLRVFLTNSLEPFDKETGTLFAAALAQEANEANFIKRDCPVMVVMGNPPYAVSSSNKGEWIQGKIDEYKKDLNEKKLNLDDDYIKFIRLGQHYVEKNGEGILAYISNNSFIDGITHRQMRKSLLETFDEIYVLNLHGNARKKEAAPDGGKDENVFDIMQGVSINIFVKRKCQVKVKGEGEQWNVNPSSVQPSTPRIAPLSELAPPIAAPSGRPSAGGYSLGGYDRPTCVVHYADLYGLREAKYDFLEGHGIGDVAWKTLDLQAPYYFFVPKDFGLQEEYEKGFKIDELMPLYNSGIQTKCDELSLRYTEEEVRSLIADMRGLPFDQVRKKYPYADKEGRDWSLAWAQKDVVDSPDGKFIKVQYKPFDYRYTYYTGHSKGLIAYPRANLGALAIKGDLFLATMRQVTGTKDICEVMVTETLFADRTFCSTNGTPYLFPLYLYNENMGAVEKAVNFDAGIYGKICGVVGSDGRPGGPPLPPHVDGRPGRPPLPPHAVGRDVLGAPQTGRGRSPSGPLAPEDVFHYIYGVLHTPSYRERYREFLKIDFPRIPYPESAEQFRRVAAIGEKLVAVHLLKDPEVASPFANPYAKFEGAGDGVVEKIEVKVIGEGEQRRDKNSTVHLSSSPSPTLRVWINAEQYFAPVPEEAWNAFIGGYQPAQKWLKDRKGRTLSADDLVHYKAIVAALVKTAALMRELENINLIKQV